MPTGDPMWRCPKCGAIYYSNIQTACSCQGSEVIWYNPMYSVVSKDYCNYCGISVPPSQVLCDVCGPAYVPKKPQPQNVNYFIDGKQTQTMSNPNYTYPPDHSELSKAFDAFFQDDPPIKPKIEKITIKLPEVPKPRVKEPVSLNEIYEDLFPEKVKDGAWVIPKKGWEEVEEALDTVYNEMLDRKEQNDLNELIDDLVNNDTKVEEERRKDDLEVRESVSASARNSCFCCGGAMVTIRGRHPKQSNRIVCPTCMADKLSMIHEMSGPNYGTADMEKK